MSEYTTIQQERSPKRIAFDGYSTPRGAGRNGWYIAKPSGQNVSQ